MLHTHINNNSVKILEEILRLTDEMLLSAQHQDIESIEELLQRRGSLIEDAIRKKDTIRQAGLQKKSYSEKIIFQLHDKEQLLTSTLQEWNSQLYEQLQHSQKRNLITNYIQQG
ncbi:MAG: hypothetical protein FJ218_05595 [Ignavibacteria bacterium]|nr:hypothetical protein [Ignavibacteria bacterium]